MVLIDNEILARMPPQCLPDSALIVKGEDKNVRNCGYILRAGRVFAPQTGFEELLTGDGSFRRLVWEIGPSETLVVMTEETVNMPRDLCATYTPLNRNASKGLMLLNAAIVEPGYHGPLSCFLLNFSSHSVSLSPKEAIAKIIFHTLNASPARLDPLVMDEEGYVRSLVESAKKFQKSFLDVAGIEDRAAQKAKGAINKSIIAAGVLVTLLLTWSTLEPVLSKWLWEKTGVTTSTRRIDEETLQRNLETAQKVFDLQSDKAALEKQIREIRDELEKLKAQIKPGTKK